MAPAGWAWICLYSLTLALRAWNSAYAQDGLCAALVEPQEGYNCDEMKVTTDDGFVLGLQRISYAAHAAQEKQPVFLMHGILSGGDTWLLNSPDQSFGFILAEAGYDVWIGNFRTTSFSHGHVIYTPRDKEYWEWSFDELAEKDLVSLISFAYRITSKRLHFIGYSQGTQAAFAALSEGMLVQWLDKLVMMAPIAYVKHATILIGIIAGKLDLNVVFSSLGAFSLNTKTKAGRQYVDIICPASSARCYNIWVSSFTGENCCINTSRRAFYDRYETQDTSTRNLAHLGQLYRQGTFAKYNYGAAQNVQRYKVIDPPSYDISKISTDKMLLIHGGKDALADVNDVGLLSQQLPPGFRTLFIPEYAHIDFIIGYSANTRVYNDVLLHLGQ